MKKICNNCADFFRCELYVFGLEHTAKKCAIFRPEYRGNYIKIRHDYARKKTK